MLRRLISLYLWVLYSNILLIILYGIIFFDLFIRILLSVFCLSVRNYLIMLRDLLLIVTNIEVTRSKEEMND